MDLCCWSMRNCSTLTLIDKAGQNANGWQIFYLLSLVLFVPKSSFFCGKEGTVASLPVMYGLDWCSLSVGVFKS